MENIRSYLSEEVEFPESSLLLSGDVGSGKSSVLLGIDFALFGLTRGILSGGGLLRNGVKEGSVELHLDINGKEVVIKRVLGRQICTKCGLIFNEYFKPSTNKNHSCNPQFLSKRSDDNKKTIISISIKI